MAKIIRRVWTSAGPTGRRVKHVAYGYTLMVNGKQERKVSSDWATEPEALEALNARVQEIAAGQLEPRAERTFGEVVAEYLAFKKDKRGLASDRRILENRLRPALGADTNVRRLTAPVIAQYERRRLATTARGRGRTVSPYTVANELAVLRHLLRLAKRWGYVKVVPEITLPKKP
jgi:hypothetical protein